MSKENNRIANKQIIKGGITLFLLLMANGFTNFSISLELVERTGSSISFGLGLIIGPLVGLILATGISTIIDRFPKKIMCMVGIIGLIFTSYLFWHLVTFTNLHFLIPALIYLILSGIFMRVFNLSYLSSNIGLVGEENLQRVGSVEQGVSSILQITEPALGATIWSLFGIERLAFISFLIVLIPIFIVSTMNFHQFDTPNEVGNEQHTKSANSFLKGLTMLWQHTLLRQVLVLMSTFTFFAYGFQVLQPYILLEQLQISSISLGIITSVIGGFTLIGAFVSMINIYNTPLKTLHRITMIAGVSLLMLGILFYSSSSTNLFIGGDRYIWFHQSVFDRVKRTYFLLLIPTTHS